MSELSKIPLLTAAIAEAKTTMEAGGNPPPHLEEWLLELEELHVERQRLLVAQKPVEERTALEKARALADEVHSHEITDDQALALAAIYVSIAQIEEGGLQVGIHLPEDVSRIEETTDDSKKERASA